MSSSSNRGEESPPPPQSKDDQDQPSAPVSREKRKSDAAAKSKLAAILSNAFHSGNAFQKIAAATPTQIASCFPSVKDGVLIPGSLLTPSPDLLQEKLASTNVDQTPPKGIENAPPDAVRDTVLAGALIGSSEVLEGCLKNGADLTLRDDGDRHILHYLGVTGNASLLRKVLRRLEKTHGGRGGTKHSKPTQETFAQLLNTQDKAGWTPLMMAIVRGNEEAVEAFLAYPEQQLSISLTHTCAPSIRQQSVQSGPLHLAAMSGHASLIFRLVERGCQIEEPDSQGRNIYHYVACLKDHTKSLQFLDTIAQHSKFVLSGLIETDYDGRTPLFNSIANGNLGLSERLLFLLRQSASSPHDGFTSTHILHKDSLGMNALHLAMSRGHHSMLFRIGRLWTTFAAERDPPTLVQALGGNEECLMTLLLNTFEDSWLVKDLSVSEQAVFDVLKSSLKESSEEFSFQLAKAIRNAGVENALRCYRMALDMETRGEVIMAGQDKKRTLTGVFFKILRDNCSSPPFPLNDKFMATLTVPSSRPPAVHSSAPLMPRQTQSANRHLRAPGFAGPRAGAGARSSSVSAAGVTTNRQRRELPNSPRVPPMSAHTHTLPLSPPANTGRRGTVTATTTRPAPQSTVSARGPSFAMPTKSVVLRGGRVERTNPAALRSGSRTAPPQRGASATTMSKSSPAARQQAKAAAPVVPERSPTMSQQGSAQMSQTSEKKSTESANVPEEVFAC